MHKDEAAKGFLALSDGYRVKIVKKLYNHGAMSKEMLVKQIGISEGEIIDATNILISSNLISFSNDLFYANKEYIDTLMAFIKTPCGCMRG